MWSRCRGGASILDIPEPESSKEPVKGDPGCGGAGGLEGITQKGKVGKSRSMTISEPLKVRKRGVAAKGRVSMHALEHLLKRSASLFERISQSASLSSCLGVSGCFVLWFRCFFLLLLVEHRG